MMAVRAAEAAILTGLMVCAVMCEPVSIENSLLSGNLTGNFARKQPINVTTGEYFGHLQRLTSEFPTHRSREFRVDKRELISRIREGESGFWGIRNTGIAANVRRRLEEA
jgi:hypothetical protein